MNQRAFNPDTCVSTKAAEAIPADQLLNRVIAALTVGDAPGLRTLESLAPQATVPLSRARYVKQRAVYTALLAATARNLRVLRRAAGRDSASGPYSPTASMGASSTEANLNWKGMTNGDSGYGL